MGGVFRLLRGKKQGRGANLGIATKVSPPYPPSPPMSPWSCAGEVHLLNRTRAYLGPSRPAEAHGHGACMAGHVAAFINTRRASSPSPSQVSGCIPAPRVGGGGGNPPAVHSGSLRHAGITARAEWGCHRVARPEYWCCAPRRAYPGRVCRSSERQDSALARQSAQSLPDNRHDDPLCALVTAWCAPETSVVVELDRDPVNGHAHVAGVVRI